MFVAECARESQVVDLGQATVLDSDDVIDLVCCEDRVLGDAAVFTASLCAPDDFSAKRRRDGGSAQGASGGSEPAFRLRLGEPYEVLKIPVLLPLPFFLHAQPLGTVLLEQRVAPLL